MIMNICVKSSKSVEDIKYSEKSKLVVNSRQSFKFSPIPVVEKKKKSCRIFYMSFSISLRLLQCYSEALQQPSLCNRQKWFTFVVTYIREAVLVNNAFLKS